MSDAGNQEGAVQPVQKVKGVVDICFLLDATGSMQPCIDDIKKNIRAFITMLTQGESGGVGMLIDWRACVCGYRDAVYDPKRGRKWLEMNNFTRDVTELERQLGELKAMGGGDEPESLLDALYSVINRGKTGKDEGLEADKWGYASDAARAIIVLTDASFHENMTVVPGAGVDDVVSLIQQERIRLTLFAPSMPCYFDLASADSCVYNEIEYDTADKKGPVKALREFTSNKENFLKTLEQLAKSVSKSAAADIELL